MKTLGQLSMLVALGMGFGTIACSSDAAKSTPPGPNEPIIEAPAPETLRSELKRNETPEVSDQEKAELANGMSAFAFDMYANLLAAPDAATKNSVFSPPSISLALGMAYAGAEGNTAAEMTKTLHVTLAKDRLYPALNWLDLELKSRATEAFKLAQSDAERGYTEGPAPEAKNFRLHIVNAIWGDKTFSFEKPFLDTLATNFGAGVAIADFLHQPDVERLAINQWVSSETQEKIKDLIPQGAISEETRTVLVNAIHLKLPWESTFSKEATKDGPFALADGSSTQVPFMAKQHDLLYAEDDQAQVVSIPLKGGSVQFVVALPKEGKTLAAFEKGLSAETAKAMIDSMKSELVYLHLPKFLFTTESLLIHENLKALGMNEAFKTSATFDGISKEKPLFISSVVHKAMVGIDEDGVEAAAATAVMMAGTGMPPTPKDMNVNRPFFFGIRDAKTSSWLFMGHVVNPATKQ